MIVLDAAMGTRLIDEFHIEAAAVLHATLTHPTLVRMLHARDVAAGAELLLTNTFALPWSAKALSDAQITELIEAALDHAWAAKPKHVHISLGPVMLDQAPEMERVLTCARSVVQRRRLETGIWFESLSLRDLSWLVPVMSSLAQMQTPMSASFIAGDETDELLLRLPELKDAWALGFNCARALQNADASILHTASRWLSASLPQKTIAKPAGASHATLAYLAAHFDLVGVCCGGTSADLMVLK
jgi:methionine synthase I (cobalamin-dependent)